MRKAYLHLADGEVLEGEAFGHSSDTHGEVVFTTAMTGYVEALTDPSYAGQILVFTYPLMGNYGVAPLRTVGKRLAGNRESERIWARGVVVSSHCLTPSHWSSRMTLDAWLSQEKIAGIAGIDTRRLTRKIREHGVLEGVISTRATPTKSAKSREHLLSQVSIDAPLRYRPKRGNGKHIALIDCGVKHGIVRYLLQTGYSLTRVPWDMDPLRVGPIDGVICSNGPGDPKDCSKTIENIRRVLDAGIPYIGVCLGHQLLALALGADTYKLPYGHRGLNQPCQDITTKKAYVTSQNHGYAVNAKTLPSGVEEWFVNLNDGTNEGLRVAGRNIWSTQFHPEGCPGPYDTAWLFALFENRP